MFRLDERLQADTVYLGRLLVQSTYDEGSPLPLGDSCAIPL